MYSLPNIIRVITSRRIKLAGHAERMEEKRGSYRVLEGKPQDKRPLGRPSRRWEDNIKGTGCMDRIDLVHNMDRWRAPVIAVMNLRVP
jgi:hypothetical protein